MDRNISSFRSADLVSEMSNKLNNSDLSQELYDLREKNHEKYYKLDVEFLKTVDFRYKEESDKILNKYNSIDPLSLLSDHMTNAMDNRNLINSIEKEIIKIKGEVRKDLMTVIDYVDRIEDKLDLSSISKDNPLGILILNKYNSYKLYSSDIDIKDINYSMKKQSRRLIYLKELNMLIDKYHNSKTIFNRANTHDLINNLYTIISKYLFLLTDSEFQFTKEAIKRLLAYKFEFVETYLYTYKIILTKIWNSKFTGDYYFICNLDLNQDEIYLMTNDNMDCYLDSGYICDIPQDFISYFHMSDVDVINFPLPDSLKQKYELKLKNYDRENINLKALYTRKEKINFDSLLSVIYLDKNKNSSVN